MSGEWSICSQDCNKGSQVRCVECQKFVGGKRPEVISNESICGEESKPMEQRPCNQDPCVATWSAGEWSEVRKWAYMLLQSCDLHATIM